MKNLSFVLLIFTITLFADNWSSNVFFTTEEENNTVWFVNYADKQEFKNIGLTNTDSNNIVNTRTNTDISDIYDVDSIDGIGTADLKKLRTKSHTVDMITELGMYRSQYNFLMSITALIFFSIVSSSIAYMLVKKS